MRAGMGALEYGAIRPDMRIGLWTPRVDTIAQFWDMLVFVNEALGDEIGDDSNEVPSLALPKPWS